MSRGFGTVQKKVIKYFEEKHTGQRRDVCNGLKNEHQKKSIYRAINSLINRKEDPNNNDSRGVLYETKQRGLNFRNRPKNQIGKFIELNRNHPDYIKYKNKRN